MNRRGMSLLGSLVVLVPIGAASGQTQMSTAFTYQGRLEYSSSAVTGTCDFEFGLWDEPSDGNQIATTQSVGGVGVSDGLFTVPLDFGDGTFDGNARWLQMAVCCPSTCAPALLSPRQELTPAPHALALPGLWTQQNATSPNLIGGYSGNSVESSAVGATIGGGGESGLENRVFDNYSTIGGGEGNVAGSDDGDSATARCATVGGGSSNTAGVLYATVGGGFGNTAQALRSTVGGGGENSASGTYATVGGGYFNTASGYAATVSGGLYNTASGSRAIVPGGSDNTAAGRNSFAAGRLARASNYGMFVWADDNGEIFPGATEVNFTAATNQFLARTTGGAVFVSAIDGSGSSTAGVQLAAGGGSWSSLSDRNAKANIKSVDGRDILELLSNVPVSTWNYLAQDESIRHMGPMAQDLYAAFGLGDSDKSITTIDADGVALAAIQGLYEIAQEKDACIAELEVENGVQQERIGALETRLAALEKLIEQTNADQMGAVR